MNNVLAVSVIVPVFKVEKYLKKCVESLLCQTYESLEIVLVDDGSPDCCPTICDHYAKNHPNVVCYHKKNGGLSSARNYGVIRAKGDYIVFVDSDDYVEPTYIEDLVALKEKWKAQFVITRTRRENENGKGKSSITFADFLTDKIEALYQVYGGHYVGWAAYGKLYPKAILLKHPFPDGYFEDCACMYLIIDEMDKIAIGNYENNYHYIQRDGSILNSSLNKKHMHIFDICKEFEAFIREKYPYHDILIVSMYRRALTQLLNLQTMPWKTYRDLFLKYRPLFRKKLGRILKDGKISMKDKMYYLLLASCPELFKLQHKILSSMR